MAKPYVYKITSVEGEYYFGVRWDYEGNPIDDLWKKYFTSSSLIKEMIFTNGIDYFKPEIITICDNEKQALGLEYEFIKENIQDRKCLNRALGKCTIWDEVLKKIVSESMKNVRQYPEYQRNASEKMKGSNNPNFEKKPWRNINSDIPSWVKIIDVYQDFINENWDFSKYGFGRIFLMNRYNISQGTSRKFIYLVKNNWNPFLDTDYLLFLKENGFVAK